MSGKTVLISGGGIAGSAVAHWLQRFGFVPTVVERSAAPRPGGHAVDLRGASPGVVEKMGLLGAVSVFTGAGTAGGAALVLVLSLVFTVAAPMASVRLARLQLPLLPDEIEDLEIGIDPLPGREVVAQIRLADRCVTGLLYGLSAVTVVAATVVVEVPIWAAGVLVVLAAALQLVRTRLLRGVVQRLAVLVSGVYLASIGALRYLAGGCVVEFGDQGETDATNDLWHALDRFEFGKIADAHAATGRYHDCICGAAQSTLAIEAQT